LPGSENASAFAQEMNKQNSYTGPGYTVTKINVTDNVTDNATSSGNVSGNSTEGAGVSASISGTITNGLSSAANATATSVSKYIVKMDPQLTYNKTASASCMVMFGTLFFVLASFTMVNCRNREVALATWELIGGSISMLCACMVCRASLVVWQWWFGTSSTARLVGAAARIFFFALSILILQGLFIQVWDRPARFAAISIFGSNLVAMVGVDACASMLARSPFTINPGFYLLGVQICIFVTVIFLVIAGVIRSRFIHWATHVGGQDPEYMEIWRQQCEMMEKDATGLILGFMMTMFLKFCATGQLSYAKWRPVYGSLHQIFVLMFFAAVSLLLGAVAILMVRMLSSNSRSMGPILSRVILSAKATVLGTAAWSSYFAVEWILWYSCRINGFIDTPATLLLASMSTAVTCTGVVYIVIFVMTLIGGSTQGVLMDMTNMLTPLLGFSWESAIYLTTLGIGQEFTQKSMRYISVIFLLACVAISVLPAWLFIIMPEISKHSKWQHKREDWEYGEWDTGEFQVDDIAALSGLHDLDAQARVSAKTPLAAARASAISGDAPAAARTSAISGPAAPEAAARTSAISEAAAPEAPAAARSSGFFGGLFGGGAAEAPAPKAPPPRVAPPSQDDFFDNDDEKDPAKAPKAKAAAPAKPPTKSVDSALFSGVERMAAVEAVPKSSVGSKAGPPKKVAAPSQDDFFDNDTEEGAGAAPKAKAGGPKAAPTGAPGSSSS